MELVGQKLEESLAAKVGQREESRKEKAPLGTFGARSIYSERPFAADCLR